jgi:hypothetical protein
MSSSSPTTELKILWTSLEPLPNKTGQFRIGLKGLGYQGSSVRISDLNHCKRTVPFTGVQKLRVDLEIDSLGSKVRVSDLTL